MFGSERERERERERVRKRNRRLEKTAQCRDTTHFVL
jgi:hypothetical protein